MKQTKRHKCKKVLIRSKPTIFERMMDLNVELRSVCGAKPLPSWKQSAEVSPWAKNICAKLRNTILKSFLKLKPKRNEIDWRNYGRTIGVLERYKAFLTKDLPRIIEETVLDKVTEEQWKEIEPELV